jgi:hypothetical protein
MTKTKHTKPLSGGTCFPGQFAFAFHTPQHAPAHAEGTFGCASHGFAAKDVWREPSEAAYAVWPPSLPGKLVAGTYAEVLRAFADLSFKPAAAIVLFAHGAGVEAFLEDFQKQFPCVPVAGGGAALGAGQSVGELLPQAADVAVLLIRDGQWRVDTLNVHDRTGRIFEFRAAGPRTISHLREEKDGDWLPAATVFRALQVEYRRAEADCESLTLCDTNGRNVHCRFDGEVLHTGADLPVDGRLELRTVSRAVAATRLAAFCAVPNTLVFGCAGLRGLLDVPLPVAPGTLVGFMFGELVTLAGHPQFGNLMAARLSPCF